MYIYIYTCRLIEYTAKRHAHCRTEVLLGFLCFHLGWFNFRQPARDFCVDATRYVHLACFVSTFLGQDHPDCVTTSCFSRLLPTGWDSGPRFKVEGVAETRRNPITVAFSTPSRPNPPVTHPPLPPPLLLEDGALVRVNGFWNGAFHRPCGASAAGCAVSGCENTLAGKSIS